MMFLKGSRAIKKLDKNRWIKIKTLEEFFNSTGTHLRFRGGVESFMIPHGDLSRPFPITPQQHFLSTSSGLQFPYTPSSLACLPLPEAAIPTSPPQLSLFPSPSP